MPSSGVEINDDTETSEDLAKGIAVNIVLHKFRPTQPQDRRKDEHNFGFELILLGRRTESMDAQHHLCQRRRKDRAQKEVTVKQERS
jgi:hypothetical protein